MICAKRDGHLLARQSCPTEMARVGPLALIASRHGEPMEVLALVDHLAGSWTGHTHTHTERERERERERDSGPRKVSPSLSASFVCGNEISRASFPFRPRDIHVVLQRSRGLSRRCTKASSAVKQLPYSGIVGAAPSFIKGSV
ncbi:hypothetical protein LZ31DRAFT_63827 [Colletotrichum somersetense]|nr:hypothetical protein LZ31DRAFT_63827 [Colletotrichum somersetense]